MNIHRYNIKNKYLAIFLLVPTIFTILLGIITISLYRSSLMDVSRANIEIYNSYIEIRTLEKLDFLSRQALKHLNREDAGEMELLGDYMVDNPEIKYLAIKNRNNKIIFSRGDKELSKNLSIFPKSIRNKYGNYSGTIVIHLDRGRIDKLKSLEKEITEKRIRELLLIILLVFIVCTLGIIILGSLLLNETLLVPLETMIKATDCFSSGNLGARLENLPQDEVGDLGKAFNNMAESIEKRESELRESRDFLSQIFKTARDHGFITTDLEGVITLFSPGAKNILGYNSTETLGKSIEEIIKSPGEFKIRKILENNKEKQDFYEEEILLINKDGSEFTAYLSLYPLMESTGKTNGHLILLEDISHKKELETKLAESEYNYRILVETSHSMVYLIQDNVFKYVNPAFCQSFGYTLEELIGKPPFNLIAPSDHEKVRKNLRKRISGEISALRYDFVGCRKDGSTFNIGVLDTRIVYRGKPAVQGTAVDITEGKKFEHKLVEANLQMQSVLDATTDYAIVATDREGIIEVFNRGAEKIFGYNADEVVMKESPTKFHLDEEMEGMGFEYFYSIAPVEGAVEKEFNFVRKDGSRFPGILEVSRRYDAEGELIGLLGIVKDISRRKQLEDELRNYSQNLEILVEDRTGELKKAQEELVQKEKLALMGQITGTVSHELRNPLAVIKSSIYYLKRRLEGGEEKIDKHLYRLERQVQICDDIIKDLLDSSQSWVPIPVPTNLNKLIETVILEMRIPQGIKLEKELDPDIPILNVDPERMRQVVANLVQNSIQAVGKEGNINIETRKYEKHVAVRVKDNGVGIAIDDLEKVFQPLYTTKARGVGLGLSNVSKVIEAHGGKINVESKLQVGTMMEIILPFDDTL
ncbi:MAG: PAS domain S-box protein [Candidatus Eremiobacteraeota bacterium]|nr:PAS domain S-box protein [Candidatus Eremiobacteraeota bacterium]